MVGTVGHRRAPDALFHLPADLLPQQLHDHDGTAGTKVRFEISPCQRLYAIPSGERFYLSADHALHELAVPEDASRHRGPAGCNRSCARSCRRSLRDHRRTAGRGGLRYHFWHWRPRSGSTRRGSCACRDQFRLFRHSNGTTFHDRRGRFAHTMADPANGHDLHSDVLLEHQSDHHAACDGFPFPARGAKRRASSDGDPDHLHTRHCGRARRGRLQTSGTAWRSDL